MSTTSTESREWQTVVARRLNERIVNDYNPVILHLWGGNIDVQHIPSNSTGVINYVSAYTTKGGKAKRTMNDNLKRYALEGACKILRKLGQGPLEMVDDALEHKNYEFDTS